jgi:BASS family bile acid:Na+ symporter
VSITVIEMMVAIGLGVKVADVLSVVRDARLVARAGLANYIGVPAATVALLLLFDADPMVAAGFLILAGCPGAPYGPPFSAIARGNVIVSVGLMVILAASSAIAAPLLLRTLMPIVADSGDRVEVDAAQIVVTLLATQLVPLCGGIALRNYRPALAERLQVPAKRVSTVLNVVVVGTILAVQFPLLAEIRPRGFAGMLVLLAASAVLGWVLGGRDNATRRSMTVTTSIRNVAVGLVIAAGAFPGTPAVTAVAAYGLVSLLGTLALSFALSKTVPT